MGVRGGGYLKRGEINPGILVCVKGEKVVFWALWVGVWGGGIEREVR